MIKSQCHIVLNDKKFLPKPHDVHTCSKTFYICYLLLYWVWSNLVDPYWETYCAPKIKITHTPRIHAASIQEVRENMYFISIKWILQSFIVWSFSVLAKETWAMKKMKKWTCESPNIEKWMGKLKLMHWKSEKKNCPSKKEKLMFREIMAVEPAIPKYLKWSEQPIHFSRHDQWTSFFKCRPLLVSLGSNRSRTQLWQCSCRWRHRSQCHLLQYVPHIWMSWSRIMAFFSLDTCFFSRTLLGYLFWLHNICNICMLSCLSLP